MNPAARAFAILANICRSWASVSGERQTCEARLTLLGLPQLAVQL